MKVLDTSYLIDFERSREPARTYFEAHEHDPLAISSISTFELAFGVVWSGAESLDDLVRSLEWVDVPAVTLEDALEGTRIQAELQEAGERLPITDVMIAGVARNRGATIVSADTHFHGIDGLTVDSHRA